jgi:fimbrial chaperone protein
MQRDFIRSAFAVCAAATLLAPIAPARAQVMIDPVVVELGPRQRAVPVTVTLSAKAAAAVILQSGVMAWEQADDGSPRLRTSNDLVVAPPIAELKPGESQVFRIALRGPRRAPGELAYRLMLEDTAPATAVTAQGVSFRMRYDLPVMVAPAEPVRNALHWAACKAADKQACVRVVNDGNRRVAFESLAAEGANWKQPLAVTGVVLAGAHRDWLVPLPSGGDRALVHITGSVRGGKPFSADLIAQ